MILGRDSLGAIAFGATGAAAVACTGGFILGAAVLGSSILGSVCGGATGGSGPEPEPHVESYIQVLGVLGHPVAYVEPYQVVTATAAGFGPLGSVVARAILGERRSLVGVGPGLIGQPGARAYVYPQHADALPDAAANYYTCRLTGAPDGLADATLPISAFSVRHRVETDSYYSVTIPTVSAVDAIAARPNGQIVITMLRGAVSEELMRGSLGSIRTDRGANSQTISISGSASRAAAERKVYDADGVSYTYTTFVGDARLRIAPRAAIRPGDTLAYQGQYYEIGEVTWSVSVSPSGLSEQMEVSRV